MAGNGILVTSGVGAGQASITGGILAGNAYLLNVNTTASSSTITVESTTGLVVGELVSGVYNNTGTAIPAGTFITQILNGSQLVLSSTLTATGPTNLVFGSSELDIAQNNTGSTFVISSNIRQANRSSTAGVPTMIVKSGNGTLLLSGNNNNSGAVLVNEGTILLGSSTAIGQLDAGNTLANAPVTLANKANVVFNLNGFDTTIGNLSGGGLDGGTVAVGGNTLTINMTAGTTYSGAITGTGNLVINSSAPGNVLVLNSTASTFSGAVTIGNAVLDLTNGAFSAASFSGALPGQTVANLANTSQFTVAAGGGLLIDNNGSLPVNRVSSTAPIFLQNTAPSTSAANVGLGTRTDQTFTTIPRVATVGPVTLNYGVNTITAETSTAGANPQLVMASLTRANNSTLVVLANNLDTPLATQRGDISATDPTNIVNSLVGGGSTLTGTQNICIIPWAIGQSVTSNAANFLGNTFVTYSTVGGFGDGFRALNTTTEYEQLAANGGTTLTNNVRFAGTGGALEFDGCEPSDERAPDGRHFDDADRVVADPVRMESTRTTTNDSLNVQSGAFLFLGTSATPQALTIDGFGGGISVGPTNEYIFHTLNTAAAGVTIASNLVTSGASLTKDGAGLLILTGNDTALTGTISLSQGLLRVNALPSTSTINLGNGTNTIVFQGGGLQSGLSFLDLSNENLVFNPGGPSTLPGAFNLAVPMSGNTIDTQANTVVYNGVLSGPNGFTKAGVGGTLLLGGTSPNTMTGLIGVFQGTLELTKIPDGTFAVGPGGVAVSTSSTSAGGQRGGRVAALEWQRRDQSRGADHVVFQCDD